LSFKGKIAAFSLNDADLTQPSSIMAYVISSLDGILSLKITPKQRIITSATSMPQTNMVRGQRLSFVLVPYEKN